MTVDEIIMALQKVRDDFGSQLPVLMLSSVGVCTAIESVDSNERLVIIVSYENIDEDED